MEKFSQICLGLVLVQITCSCSWVSSKRSLFGEEPAATEQTVSKDQYNQLLKKYDALMKEKKVAMIKNERIKKDRDARENYDPFDMRRERPIEGQEQLVENVVAELSGVSKQKKKNRLNGSVDMFKGRKSNNKLMIADNDYDAAIVEDHMVKIRKADQLQAKNKLDAALVLIKDLEKSPVSQIRVRAKYLLGEILFKQGEYDLAMQVFEEILTGYAFSGLVIKTLGKLIVCSDKLKQSAKQEKYYSILHDFFEEGA